VIEKKYREGKVKRREKKPGEKNQKSKD